MPSRPVPSHFVLISSFANRFARGWVGTPSSPSGCAVNKALADMMADGTYDRILISQIGISPAPVNRIRSNF